VVTPATDIAFAPAGTLDLVIGGRVRGVGFRRFI
jgi:hypothetical protein